jgi:cytochrome P450
MSVKMSHPPHVLVDQIVDFDFYRPCAPGGDPFLAWKALQDGPPMRWTPHHGGHWIATRGADIKEILTDWKRFSSSSAFIPITDRPRAVPLEYDPPEHGPLRKMLIPAMTPAAVRVWVDEARTLAVELIDDLLPKGRCEFIADFAQHLPIVIILRMLDLPMTDRLPLLEAVGSNLRPVTEEKRLASRAFMNNYISNLVAKRRANPGDDLLSKALHSDIGGRVMNDDEAAGLASGLIGGGLDTVTATMGWMALFLAENPAHRRQLVSGEASHNVAIEELLRRFAVPNIARVVRNDTGYQGAQLKAGEQVLMSACMHSMDADIFADPMTVDFTRRDAYKHSSFSHGNHRCIGAPLAMQELKIFLEEWLKRIPDFSLDPNDPPRRATGIVHGVERLPLVW